MSDPYSQLIDQLEVLDAYSHERLQQFPRIERHVLSADIRSAVDDILRLAITAWKVYGKRNKLEVLRKMDVEVALFRHRIRKSHALRYISDQQYGVWSRHIDTVGRMLGRWLLSLQ